MWNRQDLAHNKQLSYDFFKSQDKTLQVHATSQCPRACFADLYPSSCQFRPVFLEQTKKGAWIG